MSIEGSLSEHTFLNIIDILSKRRVSGGLQVDYQSTTGLFFLDKGQLATARFGQLSGLAAVNLAVSLNEGSFCFVPTDEIPALEFNSPDERRLLWELLGIPIAAPVVEGNLSVTANAANTPYVDAQGERKRISYGLASLLLIGLLAAGGIAAFRNRTSISAEPPAGVPAEARDSTNSVSDEVQPSQANAPSVTETVPSGTPKLPQNEPPKEKDLSIRDTDTSRRAEPTSTLSEVAPARTDNATTKLEKDSFKEIPVVVQIENGRVTEAYINQREPASEAYESTALFLARQQHYPPNTNGSKTIIIKVARKP